MNTHMTVDIFKPLLVIDPRKDWAERVGTINRFHRIVVKSAPG